VDDGLRPAAALRKAQQWLRTSDARTFRAFVTGKIVHGVVTPEQAEAILSGLADLDSTNRPYAHPYYWAAFQLLGG
jgi:CHAT domain-containing protein